MSSPSIRSARRQIVIADPDHTHRARTWNALTDRGHAVEVVDSVAALQVLLRQRPPDAIVIDTTFGDLAPAASIARVRRCTTRTLVVMQLSQPGDDVDEVLRGGADELVRLPCSDAELVARVEKLLRVINPGS